MTLPAAPEPLDELTPTEEKFALAYFRNGGRTADAYMVVKPDVTRASAYQLGWRLLQRVEVQTALEQMRQELRARVPLDTEMLAQRLKAQAMGDITDVATWGESVKLPDGSDSAVRYGLDLKPSSELTPEQAALIEEVSIEPTQHGTKKRVKLVNRTAAARLLLELRGELVKNVKVEGEIRHKVVAVPLKQPTRDEWIENFSPGRQVQAKVESIEENTR